jgi:hypothetical protein
MLLELQPQVAVPRFAVLLPHRAPALPRPRVILYWHAADSITGDAIVVRFPFLRGDALRAFTRTGT